MQRQEEGPFRLKGLGVGNLLFCVQMGGVVVPFVLIFFKQMCLSIFFFPLLTFDVLDAHVCARVRDLSLRLGNGPPQWGCVGSFITHTNIDSGYSPAELHQIIITLTCLNRLTNIGTEF